MKVADNVGRRHKVLDAKRVGTMFHLDCEISMQLQGLESAARTLYPICMDC